MRQTPATPVQTLLRAWMIARRTGVRHCYTGNVRDEETGSTFCHGCGHLLIGPDGYELSEWNLTPSGACNHCGTRCAGVFEAAPGRRGRRRQPMRVSDFAAVVDGRSELALA